MHGLDKPGVFTTVSIYVSFKGGFRDTPKVQEWLGHANIATTPLYDRRQSRPEESLTFQVEY